MGQFSVEKPALTGSGSQWKSTGGRYRYYACSTKARQGPTACEGMAVPMEKLDDLVASHLDRRDHLRALAQRVEVAEGEVRIMGSKSRLLQTLVANGGANAVPTQRLPGGEGGIRTHGTLARTTVFETVTFDRSVTSPWSQHRAGTS